MSHDPAMDSDHHKNRYWHGIGFQAAHIQKAKELKSLALTAADWAKRKGMGEEAIQYCRSYALEAERKMGQLLRATELQHGARGIGKSGLTSGKSTPKLKDLGLSYKESVTAQMLAELPEDDFEKIKAGKKTKAKAKKERKAYKDRQQMEKAAKDITADKEKSLLDVCDVRHCSCADT